jgi:hypothetical protein
MPKQLEFENHKSYKNVSVIAKNYINGPFKWDIIPLIPLQLIKLKNGRHNLFYVIKTIRIFRGFQLFNVSEIMREIKEIDSKRVKNEADIDESIKIDMLKRRSA